MLNVPRVMMPRKQISLDADLMVSISVYIFCRYAGYMREIFIISQVWVRDRD